MRSVVQQILSTLQLLFQQGDTVELRCVGNRTISGLYRDFDKLTEDAIQLNSHFSPSENVYVCLNPVNPELYARRADQFGFAQKGECASDRDVVCRRWLLIDVDVVRPSGVSATEKQKELALDKAAAIYRYLIDDLALPAPVCGDSGNGGHMLLRLADLPADNEVKWYCEQFLKHLSDRFSDAYVKVDQTTFNAARISALYGSVKKKGSHTAEQPHRLTRLVHVPEPIQQVDVTMLQAIVGEWPRNQQLIQNAPFSSESGVDIDAILQQRGVQFTKDGNYSTNSGEPAIRYELDICPWKPEHNDRSAWIIHWRSGAVAAGCHHDGCAGENWQSLKKHWGPDLDVSAKDVIIRSSNASPVRAVDALTLDSFVEPPQASATAFYGPLGAIAAGLAADTEASPISILVTSLMYFGISIGRRYFVQLDQQHFPKLYVALVGPTGSGRKGTADGQAQRIVDAIDPFAELFRHSGLTTGEGLLAVLDANREGMYPRPAAFIEREFAAVFRRAERKGNTLGAYIRDAWDNGLLANSSKVAPIRISDHHVAISAHITPAELKRMLTSVDVANGFANRFLWVYTNRTGRNPNAVGFQADKFGAEISHLQRVLEKVRQSNTDMGDPLRLPFTSAATKAWRDHYYPRLDIDAEEDTHLILMLNRQPQHVCRIASIFAIADGQFEVDCEHMEAAISIIDYVRASVDYILSRPWWGERRNAQDPAAMAPKALEALSEGPKSRSYMMHDVFKRHRTAAEINALRDLLINQSRIRIEQHQRTEIWIPL